MREEKIHTESRETGKYRLPFFIIAVILLSSSVSAYVGPGAGFGIVTSFLVFLNAILVSLLSALIWPVTYVLRLLKRRRRQHKSTANRVVILGLDGLSPRIASELMDEGEMPNLMKLRDSGAFTELNTTCPGISPVAWSSFQTGANPGKHGIFDFLAPDRKRYLPVLSSVKTGTTESTRKIGPFSKKVTRTYIRGLRKSRPFWKLLKRYGIRSTVLRVPITYPPESLDGHLLSGMCVPDLRGTQGSYTLFSTQEPEAFTGGLWRKLEKKQEYIWKTTIPGPEIEDGDCALVEIELDLSGDNGLLKACDQQLELKPGVLSEWFGMTFRAGRSKVRGISRFCLSHDTDGKPVLYSTAVHVDPFSPAVPISHPVHYSRYLAGLYGPFATLGLAEDTWALNNGAVSGDTFLEQAWSIFRERKDMFFDALKRTPKGLV
ncbi:MAG: nucleotide pyrophosphatase, partial [Candidatus Aegiribacteria sp.]|nr:nucleotide pyrophosphatase [Candidatus Aegiribacteria sp.]MBD3294591.1 nucleotide pyrophosphatase [Candidatus Fermentibacteria bacterium]